MFTSIYRKRALARLRYWVIAWDPGLAAFRRVPATSVQGQNLVDSLSISALLLSGLRPAPSSLQRGVLWPDLALGFRRCFTPTI